MAIEKFGKVDILVNNAGINTEGGILEISKEGALSVFNTNLIGPFFLTQRVVREMVNRKIKGSVLFTSSVHGQISQLHPAYTASKAALEMFVKDIALELAQYGINAMIFLASDKGRYITGQTLTIDGGFSLSHIYYWRKQRKL